MPKDLPLKSVTQGPVAARTRLKLGLPLRKSLPVQYPDSWPLLQKAIFYSELQSPKDTDGHSTCAETKKSESVRTPRRPHKVMLTVDPRNRRVWRKAGLVAKIPRSFADFVTSKSAKGKHVSACRARPSTRQCEEKKKKNRRRRVKGAKTIGKSRKAKACRPRQKRGSRARSQRKKASKKQRKRKVVKRRTRRRRRNNRKGEEGETRRMLVQTPPFAHAQDYMVKQRNTLNQEWFDASHDEIKDDPLNINEVCRSLVKNLPGIPADCREENFDEKTTKPERARSRPAVYQFKADTRSCDEAKSSGPSESNRRRSRNKSEWKSKTTKAAGTLSKSQKSRQKRVKRNRLPLRSSNRKRIQTEKCSKRVNYRKTGSEGNKDTKEEIAVDSLTDSSHTNETFKLEQDQCIPERTRKDRDTPGPAGKDQGRSIPKSAGEDQSILERVGQNQGRPESSGQYESGEIPEMDTTRQEGHLNPIENENYEKTRSGYYNQTQSHLYNVGQKESKTLISQGIESGVAEPPSAIVLPSHNQRHGHREDKFTVTRCKRKSPSVQLPGPMAHRLRREYMNLVEERVTRGSARFGRTRSRSSKVSTHHHGENTDTRNSCRDRDRHRHLTSRRRRLRRQQQETAAKVPRRCGQGDRSGNNVNNNQTDVGVWGRVHGRLLRIGRYLLRKFQLLLW